MKAELKGVKKRYDELCELIGSYNYRYYTLDDPRVSDAEFDALMRELEAIEKKYPSLKREDSPSQQVGSEGTAAFSKVVHDPPMLSLGNIVSAEELEEFDARCKKNIGSTEPVVYSGELKFDGLAVEVIYRNGAMEQGSTRGNGRAGEDVTANIATIKNLPLTLRGSAVPPYLSVRGEVYMTHREFERLNAEKERNGEPPFANPRNAAAGSLRQLDSRVTEERALVVVFYGTGREEGVTVVDQKGFYDTLDGFGIPRSGHCVIGSMQEIKDFYGHWYEHRHSLDFDIDGVVVKISDFAVREALGSTSKAPRWAVAWKFPSIEAVTVVESVDFQVGRTGLVTPVANLTPINIGGVIVKRATLHNFKEIERLGVMVGDTVTVKRAGDVIPKIVSVLKGEKASRSLIVPPIHCPSCGFDLQREDIYLRCVNPDCPEIFLERLKFFVSKDGMDFEFVGPELVNRLVQSGMVRDTADFFSITKEKLLELERMGEKLADKILESIGSRKRVPLSRFLQSMGIKNVGEHIAQVIARKAVTLDRFMGMSAEDLMDIREVGEQVALSVTAFTGDPAVRALLDKMAAAGFSVDEEPVVILENESITGKTFVFTGTLSKLTRKECESLVTERGGRAAGSVSAKTDYVVAGESAGSKLDKAQQLGVAIITEDEFLDMVKG